MPVAGTGWAEPDGWVLPWSSFSRLEAAASEVWAQLGATSFSALVQKRVAQVTLAPVTWLFQKCCESPLLPEILRTEQLALPPLFRAMPGS